MKANPPLGPILFDPDTTGTDPRHTGFCASDRNTVTRWGGTVVVSEVGLFPRPPTKVRCVRVYGNGDRKSSEWPPDEVEAWVLYNTENRPGCALFVFGKADDGTDTVTCRGLGQFTHERCEEIGKDLLKGLWRGL